MFNLKRDICSLSLLALVLTSCGDYTRVLKSKDNNLKYDFAMKYFEQKKYNRAVSLFEEIIPMMKGTEKGEEALIKVARAYYEKNDLATAATYYTTYYNTYPKGKYAEDARFFSAYSLYKNSPDPRLDQHPTMSAIQELQLFTEYYPTSKRAEQAKQLMYELQEHLAKKALLNAELYYNLGNFLGNNFQAAVVTAQAALRDYPFTRYKQEFMMIVLRSKFSIAQYSVDAKKEERYRDVIDEYYAFKNEYPESEYMKEADDYFNKSSKRTKNEINNTEE